MSLKYYIFKFGDFLPILKTLPKFPAIRYCRPVHCQKARCILGTMLSTRKCMLENQLSLVFHNGGSLGPMPASLATIKGALNY